jgi:uncharacterized protein
MNKLSLTGAMNIRMPSKQLWIETILITAITLFGMWFIPTAKLLLALLPVAYLLIERRIRQRTWGDLGFKPRTFWSDLRANWGLFILMGFVMQPAIIFLGAHIFS